jgi:hypothetical protein
MDEFIVEGCRVEAGVAIETELEANVAMFILQSLLQSQGIIGFQSVYMGEAGVFTGCYQRLTGGGQADVQVVEVFP